MPKINKMLLKLEGFQYDTSLDLNLGYYHIRLSKNMSIICTIFLLWRKYCYKRLPIGVASSPDIFKQKNNDLFQGFEFICAYTDELLILTKGYQTYHVHKLEPNLNKLKESGNIENYFIRKTELEYLDF